MHTTLMVVLKCESTTSCLIVNPHLSDPSRRNTVYGSNSVMEMLVPVSKLRSSSCSRAADGVACLRVAKSIAV
jgi:hypothetical protein